MTEINKKLYLGEDFLKPLFYLTIRKFFGWMIRLIWINRIEGLENIPAEGPYIIAANHSSYFDFISLVSVFPKNIYFLTAEKFYNSKIWYPLVAGTGQIKVDRKNPDKREVYDKVFSLLEDGKVIGIFPEGTRSIDGKLGRAYTGVARFAIYSKVPVVPVAISGTYEILSRHDKLPVFKKNIDIKIGAKMCFDNLYEKKDDVLILQEVTDQIMGEIKNLLNYGD